MRKLVTFSLKQDYKMAILPIQKVARSIGSAEQQLTTALQNFKRAIDAYNVNGIAAQLPPADSDPMYADPNAQTKGEFLDQINLGATAIFLLSDENDGSGNTLLGTPALDIAASLALFQKLGV